jgi:uncharacterized protein YjbI with pentapeptide repeats
MIETNPHRRTARVFAFLCYIVAGLVFCVSMFFILAAANIDLTQMRGVEGVTNTRMTIMISSVFGIVILMIILLGWRVQRLFGQHSRQEKPGARAAVGCLRLGSLGCGLWALPTAFSILTTGKVLSTGEPAGIQDLFIGASGFIVATVLMLSIAWFISANFVRLNAEERRGVYQSYINLVQAQSLRIGDPETRAHIQAHTIDVLKKLDPTLKSTLLQDLSKSNLLTGNTRIVLSNSDFRRVDLCLSSLPEADLREINLEEARLEGAMLAKVNLSKAKLKRCNLTRARLQGANLQQADLTEAVLSEAKLRGANLSGAVLKRANLSGANLQGAKLQGANLREANLQGAVLTETDLRGADLTGAIVTAEQLQEAKNK